MNLSGKEISLLENFTVGSVRVYKAKIKSKIGIEKELILVTS
jgi:DNA-binding CsgD family transcriptional regulator